MRFNGGPHVSDRRVYLILLAALTATACNRAHHTTIAVIPKASADIFWQSVHAGAAKAGLEHNVRIVWDGPPNETDIAGEMKIMETMIDRRVDAIAVAPSDRSAFKIVVDRAMSAGIPVIVYDSGIDTKNYVTFVSTDNYLGGQLGARRMGELLHGHGKIVVVKTVPGGASTTAREDGFRQELAAHFPGIRILDERFGMAMISESRKVAENMLTAHPDLDGIFCSNESGSEGAAQTLKARHSKIKLVGFDSSPMLLALLNEGWIDSLVIQDPFKMGETAVTQAVKALKKEKTPKQIFLSPRVVNSANIADPDVQVQLHPDLKRYLSGF